MEVLFSLRSVASRSRFVGPWGREGGGEERENTTTNPIAHQESGIWFFKDFGF